MGVLAKDQLERSTLVSEFLKQFNEEKLVVLTGRSFQTLMIRCVKKVSQYFTHHPLMSKNYVMLRLLPCMLQQ